MANRYCLNCGEALSDGLKRCPVCGAPIYSGSSDSSSSARGLDKPVGGEAFPSDPGTTPVPKRLSDKHDETLDLPVLDTGTENDITRVVPRQTEKPALSRKAKRDYDDDDDDDYDDRYSRKKKKKYYDDDDDDDYYDDDDDYYDDNPHTGLIVFLIFIIILLLAFTLLFFFKPSLLDKAFSYLGITTHFSTEIDGGDDEPNETPEASVDPDINEATPAPIGEIVINIDNLNIRSGAGRDYDKVGSASADDVYEYYETAESDNMTWYRIGDSQWVAAGDSGDYVTVVE